MVLMTVPSPVRQLPGSGRVRDPLVLSNNPTPTAVLTAFAVLIEPSVVSWSGPRYLSRNREYWKRLMG